MKKKILEKAANKLGISFKELDLIDQYIIRKSDGEKLEKLEKLEQLRILENGYPIRVIETKYETIGVDTREDLDKVRQWMVIKSKM